MGKRQVSTSLAKTPSSKYLLDSEDAFAGHEKVTVNLNRLKEAPLTGFTGPNNQHCQRIRVVIKKVSRTMFVGLDVKFTNKEHPMDGHKGLGTIHTINPKGPAAKASLAIGDRIFTLNGKIVHTKEDLYAAIAEKREKVKKSLIRKKYYEIPVIIERPCRIATVNARLQAESYIVQHCESAFQTKSFEYTCDKCHDCIKFFVVPKKSNAPKASKSCSGGSVAFSVANAEKSKESRRIDQRNIDSSFSDLIDRKSCKGEQNSFVTSNILIDVTL